MEIWEPQRESQARHFTEALQSVTTVSLLPKDFGSNTRNGEFVDPRSAILQTPGLYIIGETLLTGGEALLDFRYMPDLEKGKSASVNQVCFGELTVMDRTGLLVPITVAVKPKTSSSQLAIHEFGAYQHINKQHVIRTFESLGFLVAQEDEVMNIYLLTLFEPDVRSFDNLNWEVSGSDIVDGKGVTERAHKRFFNLGRASLYLSSMHASGLTHGDAQAKNVAVSTRDGATMLVDLETAQYLRANNKMWQATEYDLGSNFAYDVITFMKSIQDVGFMQGATHEELSSALNVNFFNMYSSRMRHPISELHRLSKRPLDASNIVNQVKAITTAELLKSQA